MSPSVAKKIVVVGGGVSAGYFARAMVAANAPGAALTIISSENVAPYERPALTKAVLHAESPARLPGFHTSVGGGGERQTEEWYTEKGITLKLGTTVVGWDKANQTVTTDAGDVTSYDKLVVAIGCTALKLPASIGGGLSGVHYVRNNADALALAEAMSTAKKQPVVIGGGYIGLEVSAALAARGMNPRVVLMEPHVMARLWNSEIAQKYEQFFETKGVAFYCNAKVKAINAGDDGAVASVTLADGEVLETDLVVVGVGAGANYAPFDGLDSTPDPRSPGGIAVDGMFCASGAGVADKTVYAVGDIAAFSIADGETVSQTRMEHVAHARSSAAHCAAAVLDDTFATEYKYFPFFYSRVFEQKDQARALNWAFWGFARDTADVVVVGDFAPKLCAFWIDGGKVVGAMCESGTEEERDVCKNAATRKVPVDTQALKKCHCVEGAIALLR